MHEQVSMGKGHIISSCHSIQPKYCLITLHIHSKCCYQKLPSGSIVSSPLLVLNTACRHSMVSYWPQLCSSRDTRLSHSISTLPSFMISDCGNKFHNTRILQNIFLNLFYYFAFTSIPLTLVHVPELSPHHLKIFSSQFFKTFCAMTGKTT